MKDGVRFKKDRTPDKRIPMSPETKRKMSEAHTIYTPEILAFIRKCAAEGKIFKQTLRVTEIKFEKSFSLNGFRSICRKFKINFERPYIKNGSNGDLEFFQDKKFIKFMKKQRIMPIHLLRDKIIERFNIDLKLPYIRSFCARNKISYKEKGKLVNG